MSEPRLLQMAMLLKAIEDEESEFAMARTQHKDTMEKLHNELRKLKYDVLSGQQVLPIEAA